MKKIIFIIVILTLLISCGTKKVEETTTGPPIIEPGKLPEQKENPVKIKDKLTVVDEEGRSLEILIE